MNKVHSKKELEAMAADVFARYPEAEKLFAREDGNIFFDENSAGLGRDKMKIYEFEKAASLEVVGATFENGDDNAEEAAKEAAAKKEATAKEAAAKKEEAAKAAAAKKEAAAKAAAAKKESAAKAAESKTTGKDGKNPENRKN